MTTLNPDKPSCDDDSLVGVADAVRARSADYAQGKAVPLGVMKEIPSSVVGAVAHDLQLERSQKKGSVPLRQVPGKEKTGMLARPSTLSKQQQPPSKSHEQSAPAPPAKSKPTKIAVPTSSFRQQLQYYIQAVNERYRVANKPSVTPEAQQVAPRDSSSSDKFVRKTLKNAKDDTDQGLSELMSGLESLSIADSLSVDMPANMTITLKPHQRSGVAWMLHNELKEGVRGGIIGDDMGLGKTVQALSLLMAHPPTSGGSHSTLVVAPVAAVDHWKTEAETRVQPGVLKVLVYHRLKKLPTPQELAQYDVVVTTYGTLVVDWRDPKDVNFGSLSGADRELRDQKVLSSEFLGPLFGVKWRRVILDEAHEIKNPKAMKSKACHDLVASYRWCLSGTPIQNSIEDLYPLLRFLRLRPYCVSWIFKRLFAYDINGKGRMRVILSKVMLRRDKLTLVDSKPILDLPQRYFYFHAIDLSMAERIYYSCVQQQAVQFSTFDSQGQGQGQGQGQNNFIMLLTLLLRLRQATSHPLITTAVTQGEAPATSDKPTSASFGLIKVGMPVFLRVDRFWRPTDDVMRNIPIGSAHAGPESPDECAHCSKPIDHLKGIWRASGYELDISEIAQKDANTVLPENGRYFASCITNKHSTVSADMIKELGLVFSDVDASGASNSSSRPSAKMQRILSILKAIRRSNPEDKCVVFCEHLRAIELLMVYLQKHGFSNIIYQGSMSKKQRDDAIASFSSDKSTPVMLLSKRAGAVGINLTAANHIIVESAWWNPSIDGQAIDRIYRIGQTKPVHVHILIAQDTVDEKLHAIQDSKRSVIATIIGHATDDSRKKISTSDIRDMLQDKPNTVAEY
ncbi:hypothetical protein IWW37_005614 [Coemansia sp. RSA 2050]|nr:hypothetical protein IWW37_005614 [Coemansia sp. RSA 2050]KAJ2729503.1 hypothetical protein IW152_005602 [Coemansia sp. BCRC 34962]